MLHRAPNKKQSGFTIIEVMIVLAIAGIIMMLVFLAIPALQRNNRNTQLRSDVANLLGYVSEYTSNNNGALPGAITGNPVNGDVNMGVNAAGLRKVGSIRGGTTLSFNTGTATSNNIVIRTSNVCVANRPSTTGATARNIVAHYFIESASAPVEQCQSN